MGNEDFRQTEHTAEITASSREKRSRRPTHAQAAFRTAQLVLLSGEGKGQRFRLGAEAVIGRDGGCEVWLPSGAISRRHARIFKEKDAYWVEDLGSKNGTQLNGVTTTRARLTFGDRVAIGTKELLLFTHDDPLEEQLAQAQRLEAAGVLAAGVAHEFNNLLGAVIGNFSLLDEELVSGDEAKVCIKEGLQAAVRGAELARQMLDFSRASHRQMEPVDATELVSSVERFARQAFGPSIEISTETPAEEPNLLFEGDKMQIYQALINLCLNARDAVDEHGSVHIRVTATTSPLDQASTVESELIQIEVEDNGRGMSEEVRARAFDPFFTTKGVGEGTGLGLSVVHGIAHAHGGKVSLDSAPDKGTRVRLLLPRVAPQRQEPLTRAEGKAKLQGRVLVADDNELLLRATERHLRAIGLEVVTTSSGRGAVHIVETQGSELDLVVLDMLMPAMDGAEAFPLIHKLAPKLPVILVSGYGGKSGTVQQLLDAGAVAFLPKPITPADLAREISRHLG